MHAPIPACSCNQWNGQTLPWEPLMPGPGNPFPDRSISPMKERRGSSIRMIRQISVGPAGGLYSVFPSPSWKILRRKWMGWRRGKLIQRINKIIFSWTWSKFYLNVENSSGLAKYVLWLRHRRWDKAFIRFANLLGPFHNVTEIALLFCYIWSFLRFLFL